MALDLRGADGIGVWFGCLCKPLGVGWCIAIGNVCSVGTGFGGSGIDGRYTHVTTEQHSSRRGDVRKLLIDQAVCVYALGT